MTTAFIALGANLGDPQATLRGSDGDRMAGVGFEMGGHSALRSGFRASHLGSPTGFDYFRGEKSAQTATVQIRANATAPSPA